MKLLRFWIPAAALAVAFGVAGNGLSQTTTESDTTVTTAPPPPPSVSSSTVTKKTVVNPPPAVVINPPPVVDVTPPDQGPTTEETHKSKTTLGPLGISHSETHEKSSSDD
jgi:hypothetical protein